MALGSSNLSSTHLRTEVGRERRSIIPMNAADSVAEFKRRDKSNVRPYVRSGTHKLRWTRELHQVFMRAVNRLGKDKATPKRIVQFMERDGVTVAHVKSHLQMYRTGKINAQGMPLVAEVPARLNSDPRNEAREAHMALQLLKEGRFSGAARTETLLMVRVPDIQACKRFTTLTSAGKLMEPEVVKTHEFIAAIDSQSGKKKNAEDDVELDLTMATGLSSPTSFQFPSPLTPEEATLSLGLSVYR